MRGRLWILLGLLTGVAGCRNEKSLGEFEGTPIRPLQVVDAIRPMSDVSTGRMMERAVAEGYSVPKVDVVAGGGGYKNSEFQSEIALAAPRFSSGFRGSDADYIDKADVYWKLNWLRKQIQNGSLPSNLKEAVKRTRKLLGTAVKDRNYTTADEAITALEEGIEHLDAQNVLKIGNVDARLVPWSAGREAVTRYFDKQNEVRTDSGKYLRRSSDSLSLDITNNGISSRYRRIGHRKNLLPGVKEAQLLAATYAEKYGIDPEEAMRRAWSKAIQKINKLRDDLGLMNRAPNSDRNDISVPTIYGTTLAPPNAGADTDSDSVVPIPSISGDARRIDVPASTFKEPADPFAKP